MIVAGAARVLAALLVGVPVLALFACGGQGAFPQAEPCTEPTPLPAMSRRNVDAAYRNATLDGLSRLENLSRALRGRWPNDEPSNRQEFRQTYVDYTRDVICLASDLQALRPNSPSYLAYDAAFDAAMTETIELAEFGRDAVRARNSSKYRQWITRVDDMPLRYGEVQASLPP